MMLAATLQAKAGDNDTLRINKPGNVTIITGDSLQKIIVRGREGDPDYVYRNTIQLVLRDIHRADSQHVSEPAAQRLALVRTRTGVEPLLRIERFPVL